LAIISINDKKLHDVRMPLEPYPGCGNSYLTYPEKAYLIKETINGYDVWIPARSAFELFHQKIIRGKYFELNINDEPKGYFFIQETRHPHGHESLYERIRFVLVKKTDKSKKEIDRRLEKK